MIRGAGERARCPDEAGEREGGREGEEGCTFTLLMVNVGHLGRLDHGHLSRLWRLDFLFSGISGPTCALRCDAQQQPVFLFHPE